MTGYTIADFLRRLVGKTRDGNRSAAADVIAKLTRALRLTGWADGQLEHLARVCSAVLGAIQAERLRREGYRLRPWTSPPRAPWLDHPRRMLANSGPSVCVSEVYSLDGEAVKDLARLVGEGWEITLKPELSIHFPGRTLAIWLKRPAGKPTASGKGGPR